MAKLKATPKNFVQAAQALTIEERWEQGVPHDLRSEELYHSLADIDFTQNDDSFQWKSGGDGDNGENLMYLLDIHFENLDKAKKKVKL